MNKLRQVFIEDKNSDKCPVCKKFSITKSYGYIHIDSEHCIIWDHSCTNCNAKFMEEKEGE